MQVTGLAVAISKDLDYFCNLVDEVTEEKDDYKRKYEEEKVFWSKQALQLCQTLSMLHTESKQAAAKDDQKLGIKVNLTTPMKHV